MDITREKLTAIWGLIARLEREKTSVKFHYLLLKNKRLIEPEIKSLQESQQPPEGFNEFEEKRMALCTDFAEKLENGTPKLSGGNFVIAEDKKEEFEKQIAELKTEYSEIVNEMEDSQKQFMDLLKESVQIDFTPIPLSIMPESILGSDVELLFDIIDEDK